MRRVPVVKLSLLLRIRRYQAIVCHILGRDAEVVAVRVEKFKVCRFTRAERIPAFLCCGFTRVFLRLHEIGYASPVPQSA